MAEGQQDPAGSVVLLSPDSAGPSSEGAQGSPPVLETQSGETATADWGTPRQPQPVSISTIPPQKNGHKTNLLCFNLT